MAVKAKFTVQDDAVKAFFREALERAEKQETLREATLAGAEVLRAAAEAKAPGPHIIIKMKFVGNKRSQALIGPDKKHWYYQFFETGAQPHEIGPKNATTLVFTGRAGVVFSKVVSHTGMAARPFLRPAADTKLDEAADAFDQVMRKGMPK